MMNWQLLYTCCIVGGLTVPVFDIIVGSIGGALGAGGNVDANVDANADADADLDIDVDMDVDMDVDASADVNVDTGGLGGHNPIIVNLMTVAFSAVVFGAIGRLVLRWLGPLPSLLIALVAGLLGGWAIGRFIILPLKRNRPLAGGIRDTKGKEGIVLLELRGDFVGKILLQNIAGSVVTYSARPMEGIDKILKGVSVRVVNVDLKKQICIVLPLE